jgi:hypothetical protein
MLAARCRKQALAAPPQSLRPRAPSVAETAPGMRRRARLSITAMSRLPSRAATARMILAAFIGVASSTLEQRRRAKARTPTFGES